MKLFECYTCEDGSYAEGECHAESNPHPCKHHCNCSWTHDQCCYCNVKFGEGGEEYYDD